MQQQIYDRLGCPSLQAHVTDRESASRSNDKLGPISDRLRHFSMTRNTIDHSHLECYRLWRHKKVSAAVFESSRVSLSFTKVLDEACFAQLASSLKMTAMEKWRTANASFYDI